MIIGLASRASPPTRMQRTGPLPHAKVLAGLLRVWDSFNANAGNGAELCDQANTVFNQIELQSQRY
jgi:hypothetical protein